MTKRTGLFLAAFLCAGFVGRQDANAIGAGDPVTLSVRVGAEYTDNRDALPDKDENTDFSIAPRIDAFMRGERLTLNFFYEPIYRFRTNPSDNQNESNFHHDVGLNANLKATPRLDLWARERFNVTDDPAITEDGTTLRRDSSYTMNRAELGAGWMVGKQGRLSAGGRHRIKRFDERPVARESDQDHWGTDIIYWQQLSPTLGMSLTGSYEEFDFKSGLGLQRGFSALSGGASLEKALGAAVRAAVWAGYKELTYDDSELGRDTAPYVNALLRIETHPGLIVFLRGGYTLCESGVYPYVSQALTSVGLDGQWRASPRWTLDAGGALRLSDYDADTVPTEVAGRPDYQDGEENTVMLWGGARFAFNETTSLRLRQMHEDVDSDVSPTFNRNTTRLDLYKKF